MPGSKPGVAPYMAVGLSTIVHGVGSRRDIARNLQIIEDEHLVEQVAEKGRHLQKRLEDLRELDIVGDVRGIGLLGGVELVKDRATKELHDATLGVARNVWLAALGEGVIVRPLTGDVLAMSPPFVITTQQIDRMVDVLHASIETISKRLRG